MDKSSMKLVFRHCDCLAEADKSTLESGVLFDILMLILLQESVAHKPAAKVTLSFIFSITTMLRRTFMHTC